jgi:hypothetical protein
MKAIFFFFFLLASSLASADYLDRFVALADAWNAGDVLGAQKDFSRSLAVVGSQAEFAALAAKKQPLFIQNIVVLAQDLYAAKVKLGEEEQVWILESKEDKWTWFGYRRISTIGSAELGQGADLATTAVGLANGLAEANPLGATVLPLKVWMLSDTRNMSFQDCVASRTGLDIIGFGAGAANAATITGAPTGVGLVMLVVTACTRNDAAMVDALFECAAFALESSR